MSEEITDQVSEEVKQTPEKNSPVGLADDGTIKVDLNALNQPQTEEPEVVKQPEAVEQTKEPVQETPVEDSEPVQPSEPVLEEVIEEQVEQATEELTNQVEEAVAEARETGAELPENIQKVVDFMSETGGTLEDYVRLNTDYSQLNEDQLLREYYQATNPHLDAEDIDFMLEDKFSFEEDLDDEREVRRKKVERKQALANAKNHLEGLKSKYYEEVKMGSRLTPDQQKAVEFFNRYNKESEENAKIVERNTNLFKKETDKVFGDSFQGFDYKVGDKTYRFKVKDAGQVRETQGDINNFVKKFLNDKGQISDAKGYHKSLFTAMNADQVAQHFYEQGKADAMKESMARTKNVDMGARGTHENVTTSNGWTIRAVDGGQSSSKLKVKFRK